MVVHSQGESQLPIATIVSYALSSFEALLSALDDTLAERAAAVSRLARFKLWAGSLGAHRPSGSRSLAYRLRDASTIKNHVVSLLQGLCESVDEGVRTAKETSGEVSVLAAQQNVEVEDGDSTDVALEDYFRDDDGHSEFGRILDDVGHIVDCLFRLAITIRNPAPHDHFKSRVGTDLVSVYEQWDIEHIREKFPNALPELAERLGKATARRRQYFKYREEHVGELAEGLDTAEVVEGDGGDKATTKASSIPNYLKESHAIDNFAEVDAESNISRTSYAVSTASETQLRVPPLPEESSDGPFQCPYCRTIVSINTRHDWKKHVFRDLRPYRCPYGSLCDGFGSVRDFEEHVKGKHSTHGSFDTLQRLSSHTDLARAKGNCPLCSDFHIISHKQYISHVAAHLEQLALFGLPSTNSEGEEINHIWSKSNSQGGDGKGDEVESPSSVETNYIARRERTYSDLGMEEMDEDEGEFTAPLRQLHKPPLDVGSDPYIQEAAQASVLGEMADALTRPSEQQANEQIFSLSAAQYNDLTWQDFLQQAATSAERSTSQGRRNLAGALATMRTSGRQEQDNVHGRQLGVDDTSPSSPLVQPDLATDPTFEPVRPQIPSTHWSVSETDGFPWLLRTFGTDWVKIAECMTTKTAVMVENFYARHIKESVKPEWELIAKEADARRRRQEKQPERAPPPDGPLERINKIFFGFQNEMWPRCEEFIANPPGTASEVKERHRALTERVMQDVLLSLDNVDIESNDGARQARKGAIIAVRYLLSRMDAVLRS
ncbi:uncharacterized protein C8A04DRAFT_27082 [Dichotomopilus funicola]|uniref:BAG domain-containing protein n=1 Tax=Dichotomopilus funicola TaxID=1934379 RepID=A0AAN6ZMT0_9PEZI|nr:hypothetical protein C8A04DRAFT_27082 [Dichotomopilus funicola]